MGTDHNCRRGPFLIPLPGVAGWKLRWRQREVYPRLKTIFGWIGIALAGVGYLQAARQELSGPAPPASSYRAVLNRYCFTCHNEKLKTAGLVLDKMNV